MTMPVRPVRVRAGVVEATFILTINLAICVIDGFAGGTNVTLAFRLTNTGFYWLMLYCSHA
jgi:hypothetical protein